MKAQNYLNHRKYYIPHHFIFLPLLGILMFIGIRNAIYDKVNNLQWLLFSITTFCILYLAVMLRQHYALGNQDRIIRLEFKVRYFELFGKKSDVVEQKLSFEQIAALRFADNDEFISLLDQALHKDFSGKEIKKSIKNWKADFNRV